MNPKTILRTGSLAVLIGLSACYPGGAEYVDELDVVGTAYSKQVSFSDHKTYYMSDSIPQVASDNIEDPNGDNKPDYISMSTANLITSAINRNLQNYGWSRVTDKTKADVFIMNATMQNTQIYYYYNYWYYGGYYPYYGWYYPGYYPPTYTTTRTGTLLMQMIDGKEVNGAGKAAGMWVGIINGLLEGSSGSQNARISSSIDQAFKQSPILKK
ncbi:MAG TPA: DUF4136 domain-containing protein [Bacteroidia bacterium]|nr:DUF4136 domain-containing protein [Bacteroidia bacterium]